MTPKSLRYVLHQTKRNGKRKRKKHNRTSKKGKTKVIQLPSSFSDFVAAYLNPSLVFVLAEKIYQAYKKN